MLIIPLRLAAGIVRLINITALRLEYLSLTMKAENRMVMNAKLVYGMKHEKRKWHTTGHIFVARPVWHWNTRGGCA